MRKSEFDDFDIDMDLYREDAGGRDTGDDIDEALEEDAFGEEDYSGEGEEQFSGEDFEEYDLLPEEEFDDNAYNDEYTDEDFFEVDEGFDDGYDNGSDVGGIDTEKENKKRGLPLAAKIGFIFLAAVIVFAIWALGTNSGRSFCMGFVARFVKSNAGTNDDPDEPPIINDETIPPDVTPGGTVVEGPDGEKQIVDQEGHIIKTFIVPREEDYVKTYLIFGIESINGGLNTDAMMLVSINTKDNTIKMTSLLRDTYVDIPGWDKNKLNSAYAKGAYNAKTGSEARENGAALLITTIEQTYDVKISGYACVNFNSFEKIVDRLGGLDIELGEKEAKYLNTTNYISDPENRNVVSGWNHLNGNQVMGYVRVRKEETLGGANNDYGRTVRQRRVITAIINKYKSTKLTDLFSLTKDLIGYVNTDLTEKQIQEALTLIVNNGIYTTKSMRLPAGELFKDSGEKGIYNGQKTVTYTLVIDDYLEENIKAFHQFLFLDEKEPETQTTEGTNGAEQ